MRNMVVEIMTVMQTMHIMQTMNILVPIAAFQHDTPSQAHTGENDSPAQMKDVS